jgi:hypothetical protein
MAGLVSVVSASTIQVGGFSGELAQADIENCSSTSPVYAKSNGTRSIRAGGFVGSLITDGVGTNIKNCYALGNVVADNTNSSSSEAVYAGGLVGYNETTVTSSVERSFAAGAVTAQSAGSGAVYAGGVVGYNDGSTLSNNAALGASVTAKGGSSQTAARIYAYLASGSGSTNYAVDTMRIESSATYSALYINPTNPTGTTGTSPHGATANGSTFRNPAFWASTLGFSAAEWDFSTVAGRGYPELAGQ